jgi:hypothetical protein
MQDRQCHLTQGEAPPHVEERETPNRDILGGAKVREILHALLPQCSSGVIVPRIVTKPDEDEAYLPPGSLSNGDLPCTVWARFCRFRVTTAGALLLSATPFLRFVPVIFKNCG